MCRLFGLHAGSPVRATFWLLDAPDSLAVQSHREPDGAGIGVFDGTGHPVVDKRPIAAWQDARFATEARELTSTVFVAHVRYASTGGLSVANTHPFSQDGRILAHNGAFTGLDLLDRHLLDRRQLDRQQLDRAALVHGDTDSERMFALITEEIRAQHGDVEAGLISALTWLANSVPVYSLNLLLATADTLWALRYPEPNELYLLRRDPTAGHPDTTGHLDGGAPSLDAVSPRIHARSAQLADQPAVIIASEPMDDDPGWRLLQPGELLRVDADQSVHSSFPLPEHPAHQLSLHDLNPTAATSQLPEKPERDGPPPGPAAAG